MFALILDSLGSTELLFILVMALIFFGPRKLPQISRTMGKSLAEFRKASEDFKRTWEREVAMESVRAETAENTLLPSESTQRADAQPVSVHPVPIVPDLVVSREERSASNNQNDESTTQPSLQKHDWL